MDNKINQIMVHLADAATNAADTVSGAVQKTGHAVSEKYDELRLGWELNRLLDEQKKIFADVGRTMYLVRSGVVATAQSRGESFDAQRAVERLLALADQKQLEIDAVNEQLGKVSGSRLCPVCLKVAPTGSAFCAACGTSLNPR